MVKRVAPDRSEESWRLCEHITRFVNATFGRKLRASRALHDAITSAKDAGYSDDELRIVYWVAGGLTGNRESDTYVWVKNSLKESLSPEIVLRHRGGTNPSTGNPAKRWLDDLLSRAGETSPVLVGAILYKLPADIQAEERALLDRMGVAWEERNRKDGGGLADP